MRYGTAFLMFISLLNILFVVVFLPQIILGPQPCSSQIRTISLLDVWSSQRIALPTITQIAIGFVNAYIVRYLLTAAVFIVSIILEVRCRRRAIVSVFHFIILIIGVLLGYCIFLAALMPAMPLG